jgi:hypothetical protein
MCSFSQLLMVLVVRGSQPGIVLHQRELPCLSVCLLVASCPQWWVHVGTKPLPPSGIRIPLKTLSAPEIKWDQHWGPVLPLPTPASRSRLPLWIPLGSFVSIPVSVSETAHWQTSAPLQFRWTGNGCWPIIAHLFLCDHNGYLIPQSHQMLPETRLLTSGLPRPPTVGVQC